MSKLEVYAVYRNGARLKTVRAGSLEAAKEHVRKYLLPNANSSDWFEVGYGGRLYLC